MNTEIKMFEVESKSKDGQGYICRLNCEEDKIQESLDEHMEQKGWGYYEYKVTIFREMNETNN